MTKTTRYRTREATTRRRSEIVDVAIRLIGQQGYNGFTIHELASLCGTTNAGLLHHFGSKDQLLLALLEELERRDVESAAPLVDALEWSMVPTPAVRAKLLALFATFMSRFIEQPEIGRFTVFLQTESLAPNHPAHEWFICREAMALDLFARILAPWSGEPQALARQVLALKDGLTLQWLRSGGMFDLAQAWERALQSLLPAPPA